MTEVAQQKQAERVPLSAFVDREQRVVGRRCSPSARADDLVLHRARDRPSVAPLPRPLARRQHPRMAQTTPAHPRPGRARCWCGQPATEVHHLRPGTTLNVPDADLRAVCRAHNPRGG